MDSKTYPTVYFTGDITPAGLMKIYRALGRDLKGGKVAVKVSTGEAGNPNHLSPALISDLVRYLDANIVECNTAYEGKRLNTADHLETAKEHGFTAIATVDIMDAEGQIALPCPSGKHLKKDIVGKNVENYDSMLVLSHFKGHPMGGFGGALKNVAIGVASSEGKAYIHSGGKTTDVATVWENIAEQDVFLESMADANKAVIDYFKPENMVYINVANNLSVDCDCVAEPEPVMMSDIGIFGSLDPVAVDSACVDAVRQSPDHGKAHLIERIDSRHGTLILEAAENLGLGSRKYNLVKL